MAIERRLTEVSPVLFNSNGGANGLVTISSTKGFKVKAMVVLEADTFSPLQLEVKRVISKTQLLVGKAGNIQLRENISAYTVALNSKITQPEQDRINVPYDDQERATYETEPTLARRVIGVDELGNFWTTDNPFPVMDVGEAAANGIKNPYIHNLTIVTANTEQSFSVPMGTKKMHIKNRGNGVLKVSFIVNESNVNFFTLHPGSAYTEENLFLEGILNIYYQSNKINDVIEIIRWE